MKLREADAWEQLLRERTERESYVDTDSNSVLRNGKDTTRVLPVFIKRNTGECFICVEGKFHRAESYPGFERFELKEKPKPAPEMLTDRLKLEYSPGDSCFSALIRAGNKRAAAEAEANYHARKKLSGLDPLGTPLGKLADSHRAALNADMRKRNRNRGNI